ncbi:MAG TPA: JAB domain-containing protein [Virgibacillus sp.]|nr:JAB domain-containing protein [Virgibacillus sp.]HLR67183.1 JAB domain-containing protein [Virgibacillus sp.]
MSNLYDYFNCSTKEELYQKVKDDDASVRSLVDFIDYSKGSIENKHEGIRSPQDFINFVSKNKMPEKDEVVAVFCSTKNEPLHVSRFNVKDTSNFKNTLKESLNAGSVSMFYLSNRANTKADMEIKDYFTTFNIDVIDGFNYDETDKTISSNKESIDYPIENYISNNVAENDLDNMYKDRNEVNFYEDFDEFASYFANQEVVGLDAVKDNIKIKKSLKAGYQYDWQESFGVIAYDKDRKVVSVNELFKGSPNASIVDKKVFAKEILSKEDIAKVAVFHNHPSGDPEPSIEDMKVTRGLKTLSEKVDIQLLDHFVIGKKNVYSFAKEMPEYVSDNQDYKQSIQLQAKKKHKQREFDLEL